MPQSRSQRLGAIVLLVASLVGLAIALYAYFMPLTGVTGTLGALVAIIATLILAVLSLALPAFKGNGSRNAWRVLIFLGLAGTCFAGLLLQQWWLCVAMVVGLIGLILDMVLANRPAHPAHT
ncbi:hypothetical protein [Chromohalobacter israelensis]|uniref:Uncharacterized protein n=1 Tax=Chromohalobacter israelensis (strain ATCC BAA-138 / DSM 3043 / CIP 106854 / NCIMB 13768 / 1H11) TaxID=290398 RepID=Q1R173_CHRI1|nr:MULTISPECIES: hypothetical protein [Chromohalobacter]ABE57535.1 hypothetical protein Csal_0171 [Chromohalobacter salexigens DSM 3043]MBZ5876349.1 hypothetical protein [Chromohalobacter salexigens]MDF9434111.1 hypothetical protein [Chromohalobacter israelensis]